MFQIRDVNVPMADTLHRQERQEHMKSTIDSFNGRKQRGVLKFLLLDAAGAAGLRGAIFVSGRHDHD